MFLLENMFSYVQNVHYVVCFYLEIKHRID